MNVRRIALTTTLVAGLLPAAPAAAWPGGTDCVTEGGPRLAMRAGANCRALQFDGAGRRYVAWVSRTAQRRMRRGRRVPLVVILHGSSGSGEQFLDISGWREKANREGFVAVFPTGMEYLIDDEGPPRRSTRWAYYMVENGIDETVVPPADDVGFLRRVVTDVARVNAVDRRAVYLSGFSSGGAMCMRAALELTRTFRAFGCNAGSVVDPQRAVTPGAPYRRVVLAFGSLDRNHLADAQAHDPALTEIPLDPAAALANPGVREHIRRQLIPLRLRPESDVLVERPSAFDVRFDDPVGRVPSAALHFVVLDEVEHEYPNSRNNPHGFVMADLLWRFFRGA